MNCIIGRSGATGAAAAFLAPVFAALSVASASAQDAGAAAMPDACRVVDQSQVIATVLCAPGGDQQLWVAAGEAACDGRLPCGAWIWDSADQMPAKAPENHDGLTPAEITASKGVWVAEKKMFIAIDKVTQ